MPSTKRKRNDAKDAQGPGDARQLKSPTLDVDRKPAPFVTPRSTNTASKSAASNLQLPESAVQTLPPFVSPQAVPSVAAASSNTPSSTTAVKDEDLYKAMLDKLDGKRNALPSQSIPVDQTMRVVKRFADTQLETQEEEEDSDDDQKLPAANDTAMIDHNPDLFQFDAQGNPLSPRSAKERFENALVRVEEALTNAGDTPQEQSDALHAALADEENQGLAKGLQFLFEEAMGAPRPANKEE